MKPIKCKGIEARDQSGNPIKIPGMGPGMAIIIPKQCDLATIQVRDGVLKAQSKSGRWWRCYLVNLKKYMEILNSQGHE